jgi:hypothetical protein
MCSHKLAALSLGVTWQVKSSGACIVKLDHNIVRSHIDCNHLLYLVVDQFQTGRPVWKAAAAVHPLSV